jgi:hypothetical protein
MVQNRFRHSKHFIQTLAWELWGAEVCPTLQLPELDDIQGSERSVAQDYFLGAVRRPVCGRFNMYYYTYSGKDS